MGKATRDRGGLGLLTLSSQVADCYFLLCKIKDLGVIHKALKHCQNSKGQNICRDALFTKQLKIMTLR
jgi:hypothetical protein